MKKPNPQKSTSSNILTEPGILVDLTDLPELPAIPLPKGWTGQILLAILHVISLARIVILNANNWPDGPECDTLRLQCENDRLQSEVNMLRQELNIKDARFSRLEPKKRPHYLPGERLEILQIRAMRGWSTEQTAKRFQVTVQTIVNWMNGVENGENTTVSLSDQPNRYPDFIRYIIQQFKVYCPMLGRHKIADILARAGIHISASTVKRVIDEPPIDPATLENMPENPNNETEKTGQHEVKAFYSDHVWSGDLTEVSTSNGFWCPWSPNAVPQEFPYCWWLYVVIDHFSRRIMGFSVFKTQPTADDICPAMDRICAENSVKPKYVVTDKGVQFDSHAFRKWCTDNGVKNRYGAVGKHGSIAVTERVIESLKYEYLNRIVVPLPQGNMENEVRSYVGWYNEYRPHMRHCGKTPNEVYFNLRSANTLPRIGPRKYAKHSTPCASPRMCFRGKAGAKVKLVLDFVDGKRLLPIVKLERI